ncbi:MAG: ABC transporter permease [Thermoplasmatota archaeon]
MKLGLYALRRVLLSIPVLIGITLITFGLAWFATKGDLTVAYLTERSTPAQHAQLRHNLGFDRPWYIQYFSYVNRLLHFDFGLSHSPGQPDLQVTQAFKNFLPATMELTLVAMVVAVVVGIALGSLSAVKRDRAVDHLARMVALSGVSIPIFWLGLLLKLTFATPTVQNLVRFGDATGQTSTPQVVSEAVFLSFFFLIVVGVLLFLRAAFSTRPPLARPAMLTVCGLAVAIGVLLPIGSPAIADHLVSGIWPNVPLGGRFSNDLVQNVGEHDEILHGPTKFLLIDTIWAHDWFALRDVAWHLVLPGITLGYASLAIITRMMRSSMLEVLNQDYVRTARAKGLANDVVVKRHARRNALLPTTTVIGLTFGGLLGGAVITETIFQWPGLGRWSTNAILSVDTNSIMGFTVLVAVIYICANLIVDLLYAAIDPRVRLG